MGGRIDTILICVKFGDDKISSLDLSFIGGGVPLNGKDGTQHFKCDVFQYLPR